MSLAEFEALPWYEADSIMEELMALAQERGDGEGTDIDLGTGDGLAAAGITVREVS